MSVYGFAKCYESDLSRVEHITEDFFLKCLEKDANRTRWLYRDENKEIILNYRPNERWPLVMNIEPHQVDINKDVTLLQLIQQIIIATGSATFDEVSRKRKIPGFS